MPGGHHPQTDDARCHGPRRRWTTRDGVGETRHVPSQSRHCSCTCTQLSTGRPPLLLYGPVDPNGGFAMNDVKRSQRRPVGQGGSTLIELMRVVVRKSVQAVFIVVAIFGMGALAIPLNAILSHEARIAKAQVDTSTLACAVRLYAAHMGTLPPALTDLMFPAVNGLNQSAGPFMAFIPHPPPRGSPAWGDAYTYTSSTAGTFSITATGDGVTITRRGTPDQVAAGAGPTWGPPYESSRWPNIETIIIAPPYELVRWQNSEAINKGCAVARPRDLSDWWARGWR